MLSLNPYELNKDSGTKRGYAIVPLIATKVSESVSQNFFKSQTIKDIIFFCGPQNCAAGVIVINQI